MRPAQPSQTLPPDPVWRQLCRLRLGDVVLVPRILFLAGAVVVLQRRSSLPRLVAFFDTRPRRRLLRDRRVDAHIRRVDWLTRNLLHRLFESRLCMKRSLILFRFMRRHGLNARIHFGVDKHGDRLVGHAWLDVDGCFYGHDSGAAARFRSIYVYPPDNQGHTASATAAPL